MLTTTQTVQATSYHSVWKNSPREKKKFVSQFIHYALPTFKKNNVSIILDVACGNGMGVSLPLLRAGYTVSAFDFTTSGVTACKENAKREGFKITVKKANMYKPFMYHTKSFDGVTCYQAIYHNTLPHIKKALSEISRVLKSKGIFAGTFLQFEEIQYDSKRQKHYVYINKNTKEKIDLKQHTTNKYLFYNLDPTEYMVPHYFSDKKELKKLLLHYFSSVQITEVCNANSHSFWHVICKK